jgi:hypothetical protein
VFDFKQAGNIAKVVSGEIIGTLVTPKARPQPQA